MALGHQFQHQLTQKVPSIAQSIANHLSPIFVLYYTTVVIVGFIWSLILQAWPNFTEKSWSKERYLWSSGSDEQGKAPPAEGPTQTSTFQCTPAQEGGMSQPHSPCGKLNTGKHDICARPLHLSCSLWLHRTCTDSSDLEYRSTLLPIASSVNHLAQCLRMRKLCPSFMLLRRTGAWRRWGRKARIWARVVASGIQKLLGKWELWNQQAAEQGLVEATPGSFN
jgi:hypothetical protein